MMKVAIKIVLLLALAVLSQPVFAQTKDTNILTFHFVPTNNSTAVSTAAIVSPAKDVSHAEDVLPLIEFSSVPLTTCIESLARQGQLNYLIDPTLFPARDADGNILPEPLIDLRIKNITARTALKQLLHDHHLILLDDPISKIAIITTAGQITNALFTGLTTNIMSPSMTLIPLIQFQDVPITMGIESLARQAGIKYAMRNIKWGDAGAEPLLTLRLEDVTCWAALNRILSIHGLVIIDDPVSHIFQITRPSDLPPAVDASLFGIDTNQPPATNDVIPVIQFTDAPLDEILKALIHQGSLPITLDSRITGTIDPHAGWLPTMPTASLRWENMTAAQALLALCKNYDLVIVKRPATGLLRIEPAPQRRR